MCQIISEAKAVDSLLTELRDDLLVLCAILAELEGISTWRESAGDHLLPAALKRCDSSLKELKAIIELVQSPVTSGGLQKRWLQVTWVNKQKQIAAISARISEQTATLTLALQMQNACGNPFSKYIMVTLTDIQYRLDMRGVKTAIITFLESQIVHYNINDTQTETLGRYANPKASSLYSSDRASSYASSIVSFSTCRDTPEQARSDDATLNGSENSESGSSAGTSSILALVPPTNMESIHIPISLVGPDIMNAEQCCSEIAPNLPTASLAPYITF